MKIVIVFFGFCAIAIAAIGIFVRTPTAAFDPDLWKSFNGKCSHEKYAMSGDLLKSGRLIGLNTSQVKGLLGVEVVLESPAKLEFCAGHDSKFTFNRPYHVVLNLESNAFSEPRVTSVHLEGPP